MKYLGSQQFDLIGSDAPMLRKIGMRITNVCATAVIDRTQTSYHHVITSHSPHRTGATALLVRISRRVSAHNKFQFERSQLLEFRQPTSRNIDQTNKPPRC